MEKIEWKKICLYIVCEYVNVSIVKFFVVKFLILFYCEDYFIWNVLYYVVKGGSLEIFECFIENGLEIGCLIKDGKIILYVVCIYKNFDISRYVVEYFFLKFLNNVINIIGLLVCYYLVVEIKKDGNEVKILEIFFNSDMNFKVICCVGFILLEWVIDYLNIDLI